MCWVDFLLGGGLKYIYIYIYNCLNVNVYMLDIFYIYIYLMCVYIYIFFFLFVYFHPDPWGNDPIDLYDSYMFSHALVQPPTRFFVFLLEKTQISGDCGDC